MTKLSIVDIAPLFLRDTSQQEEADKAIWQALLSTGGFVVTGYPNADKIDEWAKTAL